MGSPCAYGARLGFPGINATDDGLMVRQFAVECDVLTQPCSPSTAWLEGGLCWPKIVCAVTSVLGLPLTAVRVLPSVFFWLLTGEARLGASSLLRAVSLPLAPKLGAGAHTAVAATRSACSGAALWPVKGPQWCWQIEQQRISRCCRSRVLFSQ